MQEYAYIDTFLVVRKTQLFVLRTVYADSTVSLIISRGSGEHEIR